MSESVHKKKTPAFCVHSCMATFFSLLELSDGLYFNQSNPSLKTRLVQYFCIIQKPLFYNGSMHSSTSKCGSLKLTSTKLMYKQHSNHIIFQKCTQFSSLTEWPVPHKWDDTCEVMDGIKETYLYNRYFPQDDSPCASAHLHVIFKIWKRVSIWLYIYKALQMQCIHSFFSKEFHISGMEP